MKLRCEFSVFAGILATFHFSNGPCSSSIWFGDSPIQVRFVAICVSIDSCRSFDQPHLESLKSRRLTPRHCFSPP